jgi:hypothetical protein
MRLRITVKWLIKTVLLLLITNAHAFETHRYVVQDSELRIYPVDHSQTRRQQHVALYQILEMMKQGNAQDMVDFVKVSLYEMAGLYEEEAMRSDTSTARSGFQFARWRNQALDFATNLYRAANNIDITTNIEVEIDSAGELQMLINGKPYILNSPQIAKPHILDERIINHLCSIRYCDPEMLAVQQNQFKRTIVIEAVWDIKEGEPPVYTTSDGLNFIFTNLENRSKKQIALLKIIKEIKFITETLKDAKNKGVPIEWESLSVKPFFGSYDYRISLNPFGDTVYIHLPELHHARDWQEKFMPWIQARVEGESYKEFLDGDEMLTGILK